MAKIYYDMDNTLALFSIHGADGEAVEKMYEEGYFLNLPVMDDAEVALKTLVENGYQVGIISACIQSQYCRKEKMAWLRTHFPFIPKENIIFMEHGQKKSDFVSDVDESILVDDYRPNLDDWEKKGGIGFKKRSSDKKGKYWVVRNHWDIIDLLRKLGI